MPGQDNHFDSGHAGAGESLQPESLRIELTVAAVLARDERLLFVEERVHGQLVINQPAGHVEPDESLVDAVVREALEETGWTFEPEAIVGIYLWRPVHGRSTFLRVAFAGRGVAHDSGRALDDGIVRTLWLDHGELLARQAGHRSPMVLQVAEDYRAGRRWPLDLVRDLRTGELLRRAAVL